MRGSCTEPSQPSNHFYSTVYPGDGAGVYPRLGGKGGEHAGKVISFFLFLFYFLQRGKQTSTVTAIEDSELLFTLKCTFLDYRKK